MCVYTYSFYVHKLILLYSLYFIYYLDNNYPGKITVKTFNFFKFYSIIITL